MLRKSIAGMATIAALGISFYSVDAFAGGRGYGPGYARGWHGGPSVRGRVYYGLPYFGYAYAYPYTYAYPPYAYPGAYYPGYVPENATYCDPNSGTYIGEDGARHLCP